jgi:purine-nucleoside phosphorylase
MNDPFLQATAAVQYIRSVSPLASRVGVILGSGLGAFAENVEQPISIPYADIPHFPQSTVHGHSGHLVLGTIAGVPVTVMQGRVHAYEGYPLNEVTFPMRVLGLLGVRSVIVTNAAGGIRTSLRPGEFVVIADHINLTGMNAALGHNEPRFGISPIFGQRFFDMSAAYVPHLRAIAIEEGARQGLLLTEGVYLAVLGPSFETPAEIRAFRTLGADLVGMSTVHEVIVARHMGIEVLGLSLVTNMAAGVLEKAIDHKEVIETGRHVAQHLITLLNALIPRIAADIESNALSRDITR